MRACVRALYPSALDSALTSAHHHCAIVYRLKKEKKKNKTSMAYEVTGGTGGTEVGA